jgi:transketolase
MCIAEEHVRQGSFSADFVLHCAERGIRLPRSVHLYAKAHHFAKYGSQQYLRKQSGLDPDNLLIALEIKHE